MSKHMNLHVNMCMHELHADEVHGHKHEVHADKALHLQVTCRIALDVSC